MMRQDIRCYTIGYGNRTLDEFIGMLHDNRISHLVDVRRFPQSWVEDFSKEKLEESLPGYGIAYFHCPDVGGLRESTYIEYMNTNEFKDSFSKLLAKITWVNKTGGRIVLMCAEKNPKNCHRYHLSLHLEKEGVKVIHLTESGQMSLGMYE